jgi:signal transduction histidine kinase
LVRRPDVADQDLGQEGTTLFENLATELLRCPGQGTGCRQTILRRLAESLQVQAVGLAGLLSDRVIECQVYPAESTGGRRPWEICPQVVDEACRSTTAIAFKSPDGANLLVASTESAQGIRWLLWLEDLSARVWTPGEQAGITLAALALGRLMLSDPAHIRWGGWSERIRRQSRLEETGLAFRKLVHDVNNALTGVLGFAELALGEISLESKGYSLVSEAHRSAQSAGQALRDVNYMTRARTLPGQTSSAYPVICAEIEERRRANGMQVQWQIDAEPGLPLMAMEEESLRTVLRDLIDNARDAAGPAGTVRISARNCQLDEADCYDLYGKVSPGPHVELTVSDTGTGFAPEARQKVLAQPYFTTKTRGRGLGLPRVFGILHTCRGGFRIADEGLAGTRIQVYVPQEASARTNGRPSFARA